MMRRSHTSNCSLELNLGGERGLEIVWWLRLMGPVPDACRQSQPCHCCKVHGQFFPPPLCWCLASVGLEAEKTRKHGMEVFEKTFHLS